MWQVTMCAGNASSHNSRSGSSAIKAVHQHIVDDHASIENIAVSIQCIEFIAVLLVGITRPLTCIMARALPTVEARLQE
jgi:hypothetical protein